MGLPPDPFIAPSVAVDLDDGLGEGLECLLRQVVPDARPLAPASAGTGTPPELPREQLRLLPGREVAAPVDLVEEGQVGVGTLGPAARRSTSPTWGSPSYVDERSPGTRSRFRPTQRATPARGPSGPPSAA